ncbi:MAG: helix-turn-helix domain-containing protein [Aestuariibacter sp.]|nr:helix-turn-helix domain-containing protein [Aestuariibacter sp.]
MAIKQSVVQMRLRVLEHAKKIGNIRATCLYFGIPRSTFYNWKVRYDKEGEAGLVNRPRVAHNHPNRIPAEMADTIEAPPISATNNHPREFKDETGSSLSGKIRSHPDGLSAPAVTMTSADDIDAWEARSYNSRRGMGVPLLHLVLSIIALAGSLFYFAEISATGLDGLFEAILSMIIDRS